MEDVIEHDKQSSGQELEQDLVQEAERIFVKASTRYSGLTEAQIAYTALASQELGRDPLQLRDALLLEAGKTGELTTLANAMHEKHRPKAPTERWKRIIRQIKIYFQGEEEPRVVTEADVIRVIKDVFGAAAERMSADPAKLQEILELYPQYKDKKRHHKERQDAYSLKVDEILKGSEGKDAEPEPKAKDKSIGRRLPGGK